MKFTIITVVFNGEQLLPGTVESVRQQTHPDIEYWVIDGGSRDGTVALIEKYAAQMPNLRWISERDKGLYDAMNKGLRLATGDFVQFLNCGDHLHRPDTIEKLAALADPETDVIFGETLLVNDLREPAGTMSELSTRRLPEKLTWRSYLGGMLVVHQSFIPRRAIAPEYMADNLCADYDWCIKILKKSRKNARFSGIITDYLMGGMSKQRHRQSLRDRFAVMRQHFGLPATLAAHGLIVLRAAWHKLLRWGKPTY
ncbi:MAG: glycosyltransferase family 2 protein [Saprospiraceae bacterium]